MVVAGIVLRALPVARVLGAEVLEHDVLAGEGLATHGAGRAEVVEAVSSGEVSMLGTPATERTPTHAARQRLQHPTRSRHLCHPATHSHSFLPFINSSELL
jgi:hypothetical protein